MGDRGRRFGLRSRRRVKLRQQKYTNPEAGLEYRTVNRKVKKKMKAAKEESTEGSAST